MKVLDDTEHPARLMSLYWLGSSRRTLVPRGLGNTYPAARSPSAFYRLVAEQFSLVQARDLQVSSKLLLCRESVSSCAPLILLAVITWHV